MHASVEPRDLVVLYRIAALASSDLDVRSAERAVLTEIMSVLPADSGSLSLLNPHTGYLEISTEQGLPPSTGEFALKLGQGITGWVTLHGKPLLVPDVAADRRYIAARSQVSCEIAAPLIAQGQSVGVINLDSNQPGTYSEADLARLVRFADEASRTLSRLWQLDRLRSESTQLETLVNLGHSLVARLEEGDLLATLARSGRELFDARLCTLRSHQGAARTLTLQAWSAVPGFDPGTLRRDPIPEAESILATALRGQRVVEFQSLAQLGTHGAADVPTDRSLCSALAAPVYVEGKPSGVLAVYTAQPRRFSDAEKRLLAALASFAAVALHNARLYSRVFKTEDTLRKNQTLTTLGLLAAEIAHEIRNPLTVIKLLHGALGTDFAPDDPRRRDLQVITEKIEQLEGLVTRVLSFGRAPAAIHSRWSIDELLDDTNHLLRAKLAQAGVLLRYEPPAHPLHVEVHKGQVQQVFLNLALNSLHAMPDGGELRVACYAAGPNVHIDISDTGTGIPAEVQPRIFESFLSTRSDGTGLGLSIARRIMKDHRGNLALVKTSPQGTTMRVTLPLAPGGQ